MEVTRQTVGGSDDDGPVHSPRPGAYLASYPRGSELEHRLQTCGELVGVSIIDD
jgi:hypothetical protein